MSAEAAVRGVRGALGVLLLLLLTALGVLHARVEAMGGGPLFGPRERPLDETVAIALLWATAINAGLCLLLLATAGLWARRPTARTARTPRRARPGRGFLLLLLLAAALAGALRWNFAHGGLWADEVWNVHYTILGRVAPDPTEPHRLDVQLVPWRETLWQFRRPTNHVAYSVAGRLSNRAWQWLGGHPPHAFDEFALRLPAFAAALAAVIAVGLLLHAWGRPRAGVAAAFLLALHPWHILHAGDARAYAFVVMCTALAALFLTHGLRSGRWRWWLAYAACVWLLLWSHLFGFFVALALGVAGGVGLLVRGGAPAERARHLARFGVANLAAGMLLLQLMAPNLAQLPGWENVHLEGVDEGRRVNYAGVGHLWSLGTTGIPVRYLEAPEKDASLPTLAHRSQRQGWLYPLVLGVFPLLIAVGVLSGIRRPGPARWATLGLAGCVPLAVGVGALLQTSFYPRFASFAIVPAVCFGALGVERILARLPVRSQSGAPALVWAGLALAVVGFGLLVAPRTAVLLENPRAPTREVAAFLAARGCRAPRTAICAGLGQGGREPHLYDPWLRYFETREEIEALAAEARAAEEPLYVYYGYPWHNRNRRPGPFRYLDDPRLFEPVAELDGVDLRFRYSILRYTGAPLEGAR